MAKPRCQDVRLRALPGVDPCRVGELAHWTVRPLGEGLGPLVPAIARAIDEIDLIPFMVQWDRLVSTGSHLMLKTSRAPGDVARLRRHLGKHLGRAGIPLQGKSSDPHVTLNYNSSEPPFDKAIEPIAWLIDEVLLIESRIGRKAHVTHARFPIRPRQGMLFPLTRCSIGARDTGGTAAAMIR